MNLSDIFSTSISEFLSTAFLVIFTCSIQIFDKSLLTISFVHGLTHFVVANCFGQISGAHANPAISLSIWWRGVMGLPRLIIYVAAQFAGATAGHYALCKLLGKQLHDLPCEAHPSANLSDWRIFGTEFGLTLLIVLSWCALWKRDNTPIELCLAAVSGLVCLLGTLSFCNRHEAKTIINLADYLIVKANYKPEDIVILSPYAGQCDTLKGKLPAHLKLIRVMTVDSFQGLEANIVLLSLVRSNDEGQIGFLREKNRVCVALSRAKHGFYIIGNLKMLASSNKIWHEIQQKLIMLKAVGKDFPYDKEMENENINDSELSD